MPDKVKGITDILSDALMRAGTMKSVVLVYELDDGQVATSYSTTRIQRLGLLVHALMHEAAMSVRDVDDYETEEMPGES